MYFGTSGISLSNTFKVTAAGALTATSATITGAITANTGSIGGFTIGTNLTTSSKAAYNDAGAGIFIGATGIGLGATFNVSAAGVLTATSANITGAITATSGTFSGTINAAAGAFTGYVTAGAMRFGVDVSGTDDGIWIDSNDYWYASGNFSMGNGNITWNGTTLAVTANLTANSGTIAG